MKAKRTQVVVLGCILRNDRILLTKRDEPGDHSDKMWDIPGGGHDFSETPEQTLVREIKEETNLTLSTYTLLPKVYSVVHGTWQGIFIVYLCSLDREDQEVVLNSEASEYDWFTKDEVKELYSASLVPDICELAFQNLSLLQ